MIGNRKDGWDTDLDFCGDDDRSCGGGCGRLSDGEPPRLDGLRLGLARRDCLLVGV